MRPAVGRGGAAVALALLVCAQAAVQRAFDAAWPRQKLENMLYIPNRGDQAPQVTFGFSNIAADVLWLRAISYFGGHALTNREYPWLYYILDQVTSLDPLFRIPYIFGGVALAAERESAEESIALFAKGMVHYPGDWRYPFYIGFCNFYLRKDPERAAEFLRHAASLPGRPDYLPRLAASMLAESGRLPAAIRFLETMAESVREDWQRQKILSKVEDLRAGRIPEGLRGYLTPQGAP